MLGEFIIRLLMLILGYAYPAFECFKTVEKNKVEMQELRFWCQYWYQIQSFTLPIILHFPLKPLTFLMLLDNLWPIQTRGIVFERIGDIFISWLPMYGELKLTLLIYLWYPKTKGSDYVYDTWLRPYMARHGTEVDKKVQEARARAWDFAVYYWQNCTELGQSKFWEMLQSPSLKHGNQKKSKKTINRSTAESGNSGYEIPDSPSHSGLYQALLKLRRTKPHN
ncbi:HVA22-like protein j [Gossypium australe]|uniref:HVA22-like protein n=1 Tax=Gossypium australe TaxID=47621 RepID=A0A5B6UEP0_9ROSI|nr:HVA22-like protein j [Gossypium australe]